jgi:hypothetical protein
MKLVFEGSRQLGLDVANITEQSLSCNSEISLLHMSKKFFGYQLPIALSMAIKSVKRASAFSGT